MGSQALSDAELRMSKIIALMIISAIYIFNIQEADAWQSPQQYFARIRKSEDNSPGFRFLDMEQNNEPSFNEKDPSNKFILDKRAARRSHMCYANPISCF